VSSVSSLVGFVSSVSSLVGFVSIYIYNLDKNHIYVSHRIWIYIYIDIGHLGDDRRTSTRHQS
jgi:hypothetical protein